MNRRLLPVVLFAAIAVTVAAITVFACGDKDTKTTSAAAVTAGSQGVCTAEMAAKCTPEMAAACKAAGASASMAQCPYHNSNASAARQCAKSRSTMAAASSEDCCAAKGAKASAVTASAGGSCSASAKTRSATAAGSSCGAHGAAGASAMAAAGTACGGKGVGAMAGMAHHDCDACADMAECENELREIGSQFQVVPLKNGVMYVYTADQPKGVRSVQAAIARRTERINALVTANTAKLCPDCKRMRGAMASGKLNREVVNIEGGSISLVTSTDPAMVARLYAMAGLNGQKVVKG